MELEDSKLMNLNRFGTEEGYQYSDSLFFVTDGSFTLKINGNEEVISKNELVFFPGDMFFERRIRSTLSFYYIKITGECGLPGGRVYVDNPVRMLSTLNLLHLSNAAGDRELANHFLKDVFRQIEAEQKYTVCCSDRITEGVLKYFKENLKRKITLADLTAYLGVSATGLIEHFKRAMGHTPLRYLTLLRLARAEELLLTGEYNLTEIAAECGYDTPFYLSNAFKKEKGVSPGAYRRLYRV